MLNENAKSNVNVQCKNGISFKGIDEPMNLACTGEFRDIIRYRDGRVEVREGHNIIVKSIGKLIASLFKGEGGYSGLQYWAIGSGSEAWDNSEPTPATAEDTQLTAEIGRKNISTSNITFLDTDNRVSPSPTNKLKITVAFGEGDCNGSWREFGLFGGNATTSKNSGVMINHKTHAIIVKTEEMTIERQIIFTFN